MDESKGLGCDGYRVRFGPAGIHLAIPLRRSGHSPTVRISQKVLEDYPGFAVLELLDRLQVAAVIRRQPDIQYVLTYGQAFKALS